jgi:hypothetical protein
MGKHFLKGQDDDDTQYTKFEGVIYDENSNGDMPPAPSEQYMNDTDDGF